MAARRVAVIVSQRQRIQRRERGFKRPGDPADRGGKRLSGGVQCDPAGRSGKAGGGNAADRRWKSGGSDPHYRRHGIFPRDWTPEATLAVSERIVPGIPEAMRAYSMQFTRRSMLSRSAAGIRGRTLIVNLPGSPKAVRECLEYIIGSLDHGLDILTGEASDWPEGRDNGEKLWRCASAKRKAPRKRMCMKR